MPYRKSRHLDSHRLWLCLPWWATRIPLLGHYGGALYLRKTKMPPWYRRHNRGVIEMKTNSIPLWALRTPCWRWKRPMPVHFHRTRRLLCAACDHRRRNSLSIHRVSGMVGDGTFPTYLQGSEITWYDTSDTTEVYRVKSERVWKCTTVQTMQTKKRPEISDLFFCGLQPTSTRKVYVAEDKKTFPDRAGFFL